MDPSTHETLYDECENLEFQSNEWRSKYEALKAEVDEFKIQVKQQIRNSTLIDDGHDEAEDASAEQLKPKPEDLKLKGLQGTFRTLDFAVNSDIFEGESLERLEEWQRWIKICVEAKLEDEKEKRELDSETKAGPSKQMVQPELPVSRPIDLMGFLNKTHKTTQKYTEYPEGSVRKM